MRIDGVVTCVGPIYAKTLARTLPVWMETLDSLTAMIGVGDSAPEITHRTFESRFIPTSVFTADGAHFNKGRALNRAIEIARPTDWILSFDADTSAPANWRAIAEPIIQPGNLYGARRNQLKKPFMPYGYFQLWHASDPAVQSQPTFAEHYDHAGGYDYEFLHRWPAERRIELPFRLTDLEKRHHWFGPGKDHLMHQLLKGGAEAYRKRGRKLPT